jgi:hypothetical protein
MQPDQPYPGNRALQSVMQSFYPTVLFPPSVQTVFSGHNHVFEMVSFSSPHPAQFIFGNGGDWLDVPLKLPLQPGRDPHAGIGDRADRRAQSVRLRGDGSRRRRGGSCSTATRRAR